MSRISCEQQDIAFFRFSPLIGKDVGTTEKDSRKLCDIIIKLVSLEPNSLGARPIIMVLAPCFYLKQDKRIVY